MAKRQYQVHAVILDRKGKIISAAQNSYVKTHPLQARLAIKAGRPEAVFLHAEIHAIIRCRDISKAHKIIISRFNSRGQPVNAEPCNICREAIRIAGIKVVEHT